MMKKAGEILKEARLNKNLTIDDIHEGTKIRPSYIEAIESSNYSIFHSLMTIKGFLRNYALFLGLNSESVIAVYRREQDIKSESKQKLFKFALPKLTISSSIFVVIAAVLIVVGVFAFFTFQYIEVSSPPQFQVLEPADKSTTTQDKILVKVVAQKEGDLFINNSKVTSLDENNNYFTTINLVDGPNKIVIKAVNGFKKETTQEILINKKAVPVATTTPTVSPSLTTTTTTPKNQDMNITLRNTTTKPLSISYTIDSDKAISLNMNAGQSVPLIAKQKIILSGAASINNSLEVFVNNTKVSLLPNSPKQQITGTNPTKVTALP